MAHLKESSQSRVFNFFSTPHVQAGGKPDEIVRFWISEISRLNQNSLGLVQGEIINPSYLGRVVSSTEIWAAFGNIVSGIRDCVFVLDGFDEYSHASGWRNGFLKNLKTQLAQTASRVLVVSRDEPDIRSELASTDHSTVELRLMWYYISKDDTHADLSLYSKNMVYQKLPKKDGLFQDELASHLTELCEGMFLWIKLLEPKLRGGLSNPRLQHIVDDVPEGLHSVYKKNWENILSQPEYERSRAIAILRWCIFSLRPLTVAELTEALIIRPTDDSDELDLTDPPDNIDDEYVNDEIRVLCGSLVDTRSASSDQPLASQTVHLIHVSVKEFLLSVMPEPNTDFPS